MPLALLGEAGQAVMLKAIFDAVICIENGFFLKGTCIHTEDLQHPFEEQFTFYAIEYLFSYKDSVLKLNLKRKPNREFYFRNDTARCL